MGTSVTWTNSRLLAQRDEDVLRTLSVQPHLFRRWCMFGNSLQCSGLTETVLCNKRNLLPVLRFLFYTDRTACANTRTAWSRGVFLFHQGHFLLVNIQCGIECVSALRKNERENKCPCSEELEWNPSLNGYKFTYIYWYIRRISLFSPSIGIGAWSGHAFCFNLGDETAEPFARWWWFTTGRSLKNEEAFFSKDTKKIEERPRRPAARGLCMGKGRRKEETTSLMNKNRVKWSTRHARGEIWTISIMTAVCARTRSIRTKWSTSPLEHLNWYFCICNLKERLFPCFLRVANSAQVPYKFSSPPPFDSFWLFYYFFRRVWIVFDPDP